LEKALKLASDAKGLFPEDPRVLTLTFNCDLAGNNLRDAEAILERLNSLLPGDPDVMALQAKLDEKKGLLDKAIKEMGAAVHSVSTWQNLDTLASWEARNGQIEAARGHFQDILAQSSNNTWALDGLAEIEESHGNLDRARDIYEKLAQTSDQYLVNLGFVNFLLQKYDKAVEAYRNVLKKRPDSFSMDMVLLNMADAEVELNQQAEAEVDYRKLLNFFTANPTSLRTPQDKMHKAQCLARLGKTSEAITIVEETLRTSPEDPVLFFDAALVYSLAGESPSAISNAQAALKKGLRPSWFRAYRCLRSQPQILSLLEAAPTKSPLTVGS